ncbi:MAG TPA: hypothetical protein VIJ94_09960 [Caulobacteraceae bacterium]
MDGQPLRPPAWAARAAEAANRLASSRLARTLVALAILAIAALLIRRELQSATLSEITHAIAATPPWALGLSVAFTVATYFSESVIEWCALRVIGKPLPLGRTVLAASASSALSIAMGFGLASGTAARLRFYAFAKLSAAEVAKVTALVSGALFVSGLIVLGLSGLGGLETIAAVLHWPSWSVAMLSFALMALLPTWFLALRRRRGRGARVLSPRVRLATLAGGAGDWMFQGAALFVLSAHGLADFPGFLAAFCLGSLLGSALGVPADLGVLEAAVLGSHALGAAHQAAAALVLFRVIFQLIPLILATLAMSLREVVNLIRRERD